jgi:serine/threonine protein kinase/HEAT repeat protein
MSTPTPTELLTFLKEHQLLTPSQWQQLSGSLTKFADSRALVRELVERKVLTAFQANLLLQGQGKNLLFGSYLLLERLGQGGMGQVFKARHIKMDRDVALKIIPKELVSNPLAVSRFYREARAVAKLSHPNIVAAFDLNSVGQTHYLAMELVNGIDLARLVQQSGPFAVAQACDYIRQAAVGLQHAYENGLVHRDIKPGNLMVARSSSAELPTIKILDFGLSRFESESDRATRLTQFGHFLGTVDYVAPEQTQNARMVDIRADIYSLGCSLFYLLTGSPPFEGDSALERISARVFGDVPSARKNRPEVPAALDLVLAKMTARDPANRYQTPGEVVQALIPFVKQEAKPRSSPELSLKTATAKPVVQRATPVVPSPPPAAEASKKQPEPGAVWESLTTNNSESIIPRKNESIRRPHAGARSERRSPKKWLIACGISVGVLLIALLGMWVGGIFEGQEVESKNGKGRFTTARVAHQPITTRKERDREQETPLPDPKPKKDENKDKHPKQNGAKQPVNLPVDASVDDLRKALKHEAPLVREEAARRLSNLGPEARSALFALEEALNDAKNPDNVRRNAAVAIGNIGDVAEPVVPSLAKALKRSEPLEVRQCTAFALAQIRFPGNKQAVPDMLDAIENDSDDLVRASCVAALNKMPKSDFKETGADKLLTNMLDERDKKMVLARYNAARKLAWELRDEAPDKTTDVLMEMLTNTTLRTVNRSGVMGGDARSMAAKALGWLGKKVRGREDVIDALRAATKDDNSQLRESATEALNDIGVP